MLLLNDAQYCVSGILENYGINKQDERMVVLFQNLNESQKERLFTQLAEYYYNNCEQGITFRVGAEKQDSMKGTCDRLIKYAHLIEGADISIVTDRQNTGELNYWYELYHTIFGTISVIFAVINGIIVSKLWFAHHQREFIIRLTYGYSKRQLCMLVFNALGKVAAGSLVCSGIVWSFWLFVRNSTVSWYRIVQQCGMMAIGIFLVLLITIVFPLKKIMTLDPAEGLRRCRR